MQLLDFGISRLAIHVHGFIEVGVSAAYQV
jgi:hypothetical protein